MDPLSPVRLVRHGCVCWEHDGTVVWADPYHLEDSTHDADLVIITHGHGDHYSPADLARVIKPDTCFASTAAVGARLAADFGIDSDYFTALGAGAPSAAFECGAVVTPLAAQNKNHPAGTGFGFLLELGGFSYYVSGDTDILDPDVRCDVLLVCCDGMWNMPQYETRVPQQVLAMAHCPGLVVPYHYGVDGVPAENGARLCAALRAAGIPCREWHK